jgi:hypothetical protein
MERHMDKYMADNQHMEAGHLNAAESRFLLALKRVDAGFGEHCFQRWQPEKEQWRQPVLASLFDAQMFGTQRYAPDDLRRHQAQLTRGIKGLFANADFRRSVDAATNTPSYFRTRIEMTNAMVASVLA